MLTYTALTIDELETLAYIGDPHASMELARYTSETLDEIAGLEEEHRDQIATLDADHLDMVKQVETYLIAITDILEDYKQKVTG
jgi:phage host-nuclease inhibitor protein Gam